MKKRVLAVLLSTAMVASMTACGSSSDSSSSSSTADTSTTTDTTSTADTSTADTSTSDATAADTSAPADFDYGSGEITIWVADNATEVTKTLAEQFVADKGIDYTINVEAVGEGDAAGNMITDVQGGADIYGFAQDQISRLVSAGALQTLSGTGFDTWVGEQNDNGAVGAATVGSTLYAFPMTSDNGYFLYYDKSVVTNPDSLEDIVADCEAAGKNFYFEINSGWYQPAFFFGTGCELTYDTDDDGNFTNCNIDYASDKGVVALKKIIELSSSSSFQNGSSLSTATNVGAIVDGTWDSSAAQDLLGDNYACAKLPSFVGSDGETYQLGGFGGFKLLGVKPQTEAGKLRACLELAQYLTDTDAQLERFEELGWGPSNLTAQQDSAVSENEALSALAAQLNYCIPQGNYPGDFWTLSTSLGDDVISGKLTTSTSDDDLMAALQNFQDLCISYAQ
jgi:arabinogalactan oligomer/maltooligosaccharide transport system substrate-binding protein